MMKSSFQDPEMYVLSSGRSISTTPYLIWTYGDYALQISVRLMNSVRIESSWYGFSAQMISSLSSSHNTLLQVLES